ncbi:MAG: reverse transcriptase family protein, partial [Oscillospiraceae bacterium]
ADNFYQIANRLLDDFYPKKRITVTNKDPKFMSGEIKSMLRKKNKLMRKGKTEEADDLATKIGKLIAKHNSNCLKNVETNNSKVLWSQVGKILNKSKRVGASLGGGTILTAENLNKNYANISTDGDYHDPHLKCYAKQDQIEIDEYVAFKILDNLKPSSSGPDTLPAWFLRLSAPIFAKALAYLYTLSINSATVPLQWKCAQITPIPKISKPASLSDFRPISVTSILSRCLENYITRNYLYPALLVPPADLNFENQYAFRPTGSCTAALVAILRNITDLLQTNKKVIVVALDFNKAFDSVKHKTLFEKYAKLEIREEVYNWLVSFYTDRVHTTRFEGVISEPSNINASVVQGSGTGPISYIVAASDLTTKTDKFQLHKYADDSYLVSASCHQGLIGEEINHIEEWAKINNLNLNKTKTKEVVFNKMGGKCSDALPPTPDINRTKVISILGVTFQDNLSMDTHINEILNEASSTLYALSVLRAHGLRQEALQEVFRAKVLSKIMYASPAWWGFASSSNIQKINAFLKKCKKLKYYPETGYTFEFLTKKLFDQICNNTFHVLKQFLPEQKQHGHNLRDRRHNFILPCKDNRNFINRMLFKNIY